MLFLIWSSQHLCQQIFGHIAKENAHLDKSCNDIGHNMNIQGCHASGKCQGTLNFFQGQRIAREFCKLSGKFGIVVKCQ